ncbi:uncharacterized protein BDZ99DRAFT_492315 [Mytilinidion resinicola]|uniref:Xylanolytic transcriptional activator regulatory domain-containing protein n=1 Tax=Mytilinidion resinicola TaxID=574789 RepID=A0A6A6XZC9_9PEZI|nr:uncharacterized protein BDZ99DRAFT_492315 [Mytilinidion resinicola]KAF2801921.1 hypothetical protein BDZ99DRAFT_492315 [Mytilinidion resinicola]
MSTSAEIGELQPGGLGTLQRTKRHQVGRACDWYRVYRIKLQELQYQVTCSKLRKRIKPIVSLPTYLGPFREHGGNWKYLEPYYTRSHGSLQAIYYGTASPHYFIGRLNVYLQSILPSSRYDQDKQLDIMPTTEDPEPRNVPIGFLASSLIGTERVLETTLSRLQEKTLLDSFWQSYHLSYPILDKEEIMSHVDSLWVPFVTHRQPSALIDIILALCTQHSASHPPMHSVMIMHSIEEPSLNALQCQILSILYLQNVSRPNTANIMLATAIRTAIVLGLHREAPKGTSTEEEQTRKRIFWTLYALEMDSAMQLGRPLAVNMSQVTCNLPDTNETPLTIQSDSSLNIMKTCYAFNLQYIKLILAARATYVSFNHKCADVRGPQDQDCLYNNAEGLETCAEFLSQKIDYMYNWSRNVPEVLRYIRKIRQRGLCPLALLQPLWLERQRTLLELRYHNLAMTLFRPFICFAGVAKTTPISFTISNANHCLHHATIITQTILQALTESDVLHGQHEVFRVQWNATLSLVGYLTAYPSSDTSHACREDIHCALQVLEIFSSWFPMAGRAVDVVGKLLSRIGFPIDSSADTRMMFDPELTAGNGALLLEYPDLVHDTIA